MSARPTSPMPPTPSAHERDKKHIISSAPLFATGSADRERRRLLAVLAERGNGSVLRGWRHELDPLGSLELGFQELSEAIASLGVAIDVAKVFLDVKTPSILTLGELTPTDGALVDHFRGWIKRTFGGPGEMFTVFDKLGAGQLTREDFVAGCRAHRLPAKDADIAELFNFLDPDEDGFVRRHEVMFLETDRRIREQEIFKLKMRSKHQRQRLLAYVHMDADRSAPSLAHRTAPRPWHASCFERLPALASERHLKWQRTTCKRAVEARRAFRRHMVKTYGNEVRAWRRGIDPDAAFKVDRTSLFRYCRDHDIEVDLPSLWRGLDRDCDGWFRIEDFATPQALQLSHFRVWAQELFGSCADAWDHPELSDRRSKPQGADGRWVSDKKMLASAFLGGLRALGWVSTPELDASTLCGALDLYMCGFVCRADLSWLDQWEPPEWLTKAPDPGAYGELRMLMLHHYGEPLKAWRALMDVDNDNQVNWDEFQEACKKLKFRGNIGGAWRHIDSNISGTISLQEFDPRSAELLSSFKTWCEANFGSVEFAFKAFDIDGSGAVTYSELRRACRRLNWQGEVRLLFTCLGREDKTEAGQRILALKDVIFLDDWVDALLAEHEDDDLASTAPSTPKFRYSTSKMSTSTLSCRSANQLAMRRTAPAVTVGGDALDGLAEDGMATGPSLQRSVVFDRLFRDAAHREATRPRIPAQQVSGSMSSPNLFGTSAVAEQARLNRAYQCVDLATTKLPGATQTLLRPRQSKPKAGLRAEKPPSLSWLQRIDHIDRAFDARNSAAATVT